MQLEDKRQSLSLKSHEEQQQKCLRFFPVLPMFLFWVGRLQLFFHPHKTNSHEVYWDFAETILSVLNAQSTEQNNGCRDPHEHEAQNEVSILCVVHFFVTIPLKNKGRQGGTKFSSIPFRRYSVLTVCMYFRITVQQEDRKEPGN